MSRRVVVRAPATRVAGTELTCIVSHRCALFFALFVLLWPSPVLAAGIHVRFSLDDPTAGPFPSNLFTVQDLSQNTGLRVNVPFPDCAERPSDCEDLDVINTLDGFNIQPRLSVPFSGPIDVKTVTSETVFLISLGSTLPWSVLPTSKIIGINQVVWDPATNTLHFESDTLLDQHTRYALIVTRGVQDLEGDPVERIAFQRFHATLRKNRDLQSYNTELQNALKTSTIGGIQLQDIVALSVFTTQSVTATLEKIRRIRLNGVPLAPADFLLGSNGTRTVFSLEEVTGITFNRQVGTDLSSPESFIKIQVPVGALGFVPGVVGTLAFGQYVSPNFLTTGQVIPPTGTLSEAPVVQGRNEIFFNLFLPAGPKPASGWPVAIHGHGNTASKEDSPFFFAATMAASRLATITINVVGHGGGPLGTLIVNRTTGDPVTFPAGGRGIDQNGDGVIDPDEGLLAAPPQTIISTRDSVQQTVVDLIQLVRVIKVGMDIDGDGTVDLDPSRISYFGQSLGGNYGTLFLAVEPRVRAGVQNVPGGPLVEIVRLSPTFRPLLGFTLASRVPPLINIGDISAGDFRFDENLPLRNQPPVINDVPGAIAIQEFIDRSEWVAQAGCPVAYAPHLWKNPLAGMAVKDVIYQFARGDQTVPNPTTTAILRAGDLADHTTLYRHDLAFADPDRNPTGTEVPTNPHLFLFFNPFFFPAVADVALRAQLQIAVFLASDGTLVIDPDGDTGPLFEVPIEGPLPEDCGFLPEGFEFIACQ